MQLCWDSFLIANRQQRPDFNANLFDQITPITLRLSEFTPETVSAIFMIYKDKDIRIVPLAPCHRDMYISLYSSQRIMQFIGEPQHQPNAEKYFQYAVTGKKMKGLKQYLFAIESADGNQHYGLTILMLHDSLPNFAEYGIMMLKKGQGRGIAKAATQATCQHAFELLQCEGVVAHIEPDNLPTNRLARSVGFEPHCESIPGFNSERRLNWLLSCQSFTTK